MTTKYGVLQAAERADLERRIAEARQAQVFKPYVPKPLPWQERLDEYRRIKSLMP